ncbi:MULTISPECIES: hypothetical protein [unclassified Bradyrhizobium]
MSLAVRNQIDVTVRLAGNAIAAIEILPRARPPLARLFAGKPPASLLNVLSRIFSLCAAAHQVAFLSASEAACGEEISVATRQHRIALIVAERLAELLRSLFVRYFALDTASVAAIRALMDAVSMLLGSTEPSGGQVPTEWNFHARGPVVRGLQGAVLTARQQGEGAVRAMIASFDPCVGFTLNFREVGDA